MDTLDGGRSRAKENAVIERMHEEIVIREHTLHQSLAFVEPETIEDAAALAVLIAEAFDIFSDQYVDSRFDGDDGYPSVPISDREPWQYRCDKPMMWSMLRTLIRCLAGHAKTPDIGWELWEEGLHAPFEADLAETLEAAQDKARHETVADPR
jgi:hypothetical protein